MEFYKKNIETLSLLLNKTKRNRNIITLGKLISAGIIIWLAYVYITTGSWLYLFSGIFCLLIFTGLSVIDSKVVSLIEETEALIGCNQTEINYLNNDFTKLDKGEKYIDPRHNYSFDLDIFGDNSLFQSINRTVTPGGGDILANWLLNPCQDPEEILEKQHAAGEISEKRIWNLSFRSAGKIHRISSAETREIEEWASEPLFFKHPRIVKSSIWVLTILSINVWIIFFAGLIPFMYALSTFLLLLLISFFYSARLNQIQQRLGEFISAFSNYYFLVRKIREEKFESVLLSGLYEHLFKDTNALEAFNGLKKMGESFDQRNNFLVAIFFNGFYLRNIRLLLTLDKWKKTYSKHILEWIGIVNRFDALSSMANYRNNHPDYTIPLIDHNMVMEASEMGHPLLRKKIKVNNDFKIDRIHMIYLITGANMAGKSTFLRTVGVNLVLALSGNVVHAASFRCRPINIFTSMRTSDNLSEGTSYFHAELLRLKKLISQASEGKETFTILDEMLKGTNSTDKLNGSLRFLTRLLDLPVTGLIATHDLALSELEVQYPDNFFNVCFEIEHKDNDIQYDYKLKKGVCKNMNATFLLEKMGLIKSREL
jgi:hypothetical protein